MDANYREGYSMSKVSKMTGLSRHKLYLALLSGELEAFYIRPNLMNITKRSLDAYISRKNNK